MNNILFILHRLERRPLFILSWPPEFMRIFHGFRVPGNAGPAGAKQLSSGLVPPPLGASDLECKREWSLG